jgi:carbon storage regulator
MIGRDVKITVLSVMGETIRIGIEAPASIGIHREEIYLEIERENVQAAASIRTGQGPARPSHELRRALPPVRSV